MMAQYEAGVIGSGPAGLAAALELSRRQIQTAVFESADRIGGLSGDLCCKADPVCQRCDACSPADIRREAERSGYVTFYTNAGVNGVSGSPGSYTLHTSGGDFSVKTVIAAVGSPTYDPKRDPRYSYSESQDILTSRDMEALMSSGEVKVPSSGRTPESIAVIQCVGSRDARHGVPYCSKVCCKYSLKLMKRLRRDLPQTEVTFFYRDWRPSDRGYDKLSEYGREKGVHVVRSRPGEVLPLNRPAVRYASAEEEVKEEAFDIVILAVGLMPPADSELLASQLGLELNKYGFFLKQGNGAYPAGCCTGPKDIRESVEEGIAAAGRAAAFLGWKP